METVKKSVNSWVYRFITKDKVFGIAEGYPQGYLQTTCDIRKYFILSCIRTVFMPLFVVFICLCILYLLVIHPVIVIIGSFTGMNLSDTAYALAIIFGVVDTFILIALLQEYGHIPQSISNTFSEGFEIVKSKVCSKVEWVE